MKPVDQTIVDDKVGDCLRASVCSLLELPIADVPNFAEIGFFEGLDVWLAKRGLRFIRIGLPVGDYASLKGHKFSVSCLWLGFAGQEGQPEYMLAWGHGPRLNAEGRHRQHIVVARANGYGVKLAHDPHSSRAGLVDYQGFGWIVSAAQGATQ